MCCFICFFGCDEDDDDDIHFLVPFPSPNSMAADSNFVRTICGLDALVSFRLLCCCPGMGSNGVNVAKFLQLLMIVYLYLERSYFLSQHPPSAIPFSACRSLLLNRRRVYPHTRRPTGLHWRTDTAGTISGHRARSKEQRDHNSEISLGGFDQDH